MYLDPQELVRLITEAQKTSIVSDRLAMMVRRIAVGVQCRYHPWLDQDDFAHETVIRFLRYYKQCDVARPPSEVFAWVTSIATSYGLQVDRSLASYRRKLQQYAEVLGDDCPTE